MDMYSEYGGCNSAGVIIGIGSIHQKKCMIVANDATVKARIMVSYDCKKKSKSTNSY